MTFFEWKTNLLLSVEEFTKFWEDGHVADQKQFPADMYEGDWDEQFEYFQDRLENEE